MVPCAQVKCFQIANLHQLFSVKGRNKILAQWCSQPSMASAVSQRGVLACGDFLASREHLFSWTCAQFTLTHEVKSDPERGLDLAGTTSAETCPFLRLIHPPPRSLSFPSICPLPFQSLLASLQILALPYLLWWVSSISCLAAYTGAVAFVTAIKLFASVEHIFHCKWLRSKCSLQVALLVVTDYGVQCSSMFLSQRVVPLWLCDWHD